MDSICENCGATGFVELLVNCRKCHTSVAHRYCLEKIPGRHEEVCWFCDMCETNSLKIVPVKELILPSGRDKGNVECPDRQPNCSDRIVRTKDHYQQLRNPAEAVSSRDSGPTSGSVLVRLSKSDVPFRRPFFSITMSINEFKSVVQKKGKDCGDTSLKLNGDKKLQRHGLISVDDDENNITRRKECYEQIFSPAEIVSTQKLESGPTSSSVHVVKQGEDYGRTSLGRTEVKKSKRRRLVLADEELDEEFQPNTVVSQHIPKATKIPTDDLVSLPSVETVPSSANKKLPDEDVSRRLQIVAVKTSSFLQAETNHSQSNMNQPFYQAAQPIIDRAWRGCFYIRDEEYGPLSAHLSNKACGKVSNVSKLLPAVLRMEKLPRLDAWPNSFKIAPPTDENIGLYFFPECARAASLFRQLLDEVIKKDLVLKLALDGVELLVFPATILPRDHQKFQGKHYFWGVFRGRQDPPALKFHSESKSNERKEEERLIEVLHAEDKVELDGCEEVFSDVTESSPSTNRVSNSLQPNELPEEMQRTKISCKHSGERERGEQQRMVEVSNCSREIEEGEICDNDKEEGEIYDDLEDLDISRNAECLELFPLSVESMGIVSKVGADDELNLDLGLGRRSADGKGHCGDRIGKGSKMFFDGFD